MPRPICCYIDINNFANNLSIVKKLVGATKIWSVVKANAYGHGLQNALKGLSETDGFALLDLHEAQRLRDSGWTGPILLLEGFFEYKDLDLVDDKNLTVAVHSIWQLEMLEQYNFKNSLNVYIKINSGMNRLGFGVDEVPSILARLKKVVAVEDITLMSHFASADVMDGLNDQLVCIKQLKVSNSPKMCLANSAATLWHTQTHGEWVRPGIILYGASPSGDSSHIAYTGLKPVMSLISKIIAVQKLKPGEKVGYGGRYVATKHEIIGVVACGYADGYPRSAPSGTPVIVEGIRTRTVGTVSMDMLTIDLTPCPNAFIGSEVELWGKQLPVDDVAQAAGTIGYELLSAITSRVPVKVL
ncbi:alanine racemase [Citrobacter braakii]|uniref:alanine racemase n=1 Tax=Citrobacter braakii TaxID=57706 RepID=UPI00397BAB55